MLRVSEITVQYLDRPVGLGGRPWFGWKLESDRRNVIQEAYCLEIGADADCSRLVWKSGWVESHESVHVEAEGFAPESCTKYYEMCIRDRLPGGLQDPLSGGGADSRLVIQRHGNGGFR